jgi:hypothetical protein
MMTMKILSVLACLLFFGCSSPSHESHVNENVPNDGLTAWERFKANQERDALIGRQHYRVLAAQQRPEPKQLPPVQEEPAGPVEHPSSGGGTRLVTLLLFGGDNHRAFLGCLTCGEYGVDSVFNEYGLHGSKYALESIWNEYGMYGSKYSAYSPWNPYASDPPIIVDPDGNAYGLLTVNKFNPNRTHIPSLLRMLGGY